MIKRLFDIVCALAGVCLFSPVLIVVALLVKATSRGPVLHWSERVGKDNKNFWMPKFRTMQIDSPQVATHLLKNPAEYATAIGPFLRRTSLDELPQLFSVLGGDLSLVGPRPALFNQDDLIALRTARKIHLLIPGITGWAQVNGRDELPIPVKVDFDTHYLHHRSFLFDIRILLLTVLKVFRAEGVRH
jgi:O-antigen biosynthesis protein WbqP